MIRLGNLDKWQSLGEGEIATFAGLQRTVALEVNSPDGATLYVNADAYPGPVFIGLVQGRDRIEFAVDGDFELSVESGELWFYTADGAQTATPASEDAIIFTRIANRKARNPNLEMMEFRMNQNMNRRLREMEAEATRRLEDVERRYAAGRNPRTPVDLVTDTAIEGGVTAQAAERAEDAARAATADGGKGKKGGVVPTKQNPPDGASDN